MIKSEKGLIEKLRLNKSEARLMMLLEEVNLKFKAEFRMQEIFQIENLLKEHRQHKTFNRMFKDQARSVPHMFPRARTDKALLLDHNMISKTERHSDQKIMICKIAEVEATTTHKRSELNTDKKTDPEEVQLSKRSNKKSNNNSLNLKASDSKTTITCRAPTLTTTEELMIKLTNKKNQETVLHHSGRIDKEVNLETRRVSNSHLEIRVYFDV